MSSGKERSDDRKGPDPRQLRALAHPIRLDLLHLLERDGPLTASQAARQLRLTPKECSYHLGVLGKYGLAEEAGGGKGRSRPWRVVRTGINYTHHPDEDPTIAYAEDAFAKTVLARDARTIEAFIDGRHHLPQAWRNVAAMSSNPLRLTPDQLRDLRQDLLRVLDRYLEQSRSPAPGAHAVHTVIYAVPTDLTDLTAAARR